MMQPHFSVSKVLFNSKNKELEALSNMCQVRWIFNSLNNIHVLESNSDVSLAVITFFSLKV